MTTRLAEKDRGRAEMTNLDEIAFQCFMAWCGQPPEDQRATFEAACRARWNVEADHNSREGWRRVASVFIRLIPAEPQTEILSAYSILNFDDGFCNPDKIDR
jgi:hypothetical protein